MKKLHVIIKNDIDILKYFEFYLIKNKLVSADFLFENSLDTSRKYMHVSPTRSESLFSNTLEHPEQPLSNGEVQISRQHISDLWRSVKSENAGNHKDYPEPYLVHVRITEKSEEVSTGTSGWIITQGGTDKKVYGDWKFTVVSRRVSATGPSRRYPRHSR